MDDFPHEFISNAYISGDLSSKQMDEMIKKQARLHTMKIAIDNMKHMNEKLKEDEEKEIKASLKEKNQIKRKFNELRMNNLMFHSSFITGSSLE